MRGIQNFVFYSGFYFQDLHRVLMVRHEKDFLEALAGGGEVWSLRHACRALSIKMPSVPWKIIVPQLYPPWGRAFLPLQPPLTFASPN